MRMFPLNLNPELFHGKVAKIASKDAALDYLAVIS